MVSSSDETNVQKAGPKSRTKNEYYISCAFCPFSCLRDDEFKKHIDELHKNDLFKFPCDECGFNAQGPKYLRQHKSEVHAKVGDENQDLNQDSNGQANDIAAITDDEPEKAVNEESKIDKISNEPIQVPDAKS